MKIVFDHQCFQDQAEGGISRYMIALARGLSECGHEVTVFAGFTRAEQLRKKLGVSVQMIGGRKTGFFGQKSISFINRVWFTAWSWGVCADIYHPTYYRFFRSPRKAKRVLTVLDYIHERFTEVAVSDPFIVQLKARAIEQADAVLCISWATRYDLERFFPAALAKAHVIYLGSDLSRSAPAEKNRQYILYVGRRGLYKNFRVLAAAFARSDKLRERFDLVLVGGEPELDEPLVGVRYQRVLASDTELAGLYAGAAVFVYPSRYEGFGLPLIEAMRCGCPVVTTRGGSLQEVAGGAAEYFNPDAPDELVEAIRRVTSDQVLRSRLVLAGKQRAEYFTWGQCVEKTLNVYQQLLNRNA